MGVKYFGQFLRDRGVVTEPALQKALELQALHNLDLGKICERLGFLSPAAVARLQQQQRTVDRRIGELAVASGLMSEAQLDEALAAQKSQHVPLGEALVQIGALSPARLTEELAAFSADQSPYLIEALEIPAGVPDRDAAEACIDLARKLLLRLARVQTKLGALTWMPAAKVDGYILAVQPLAGPTPMTLVVSLSTMAARQVLHGMLGFAPDNATIDDERGALVELVSVISSHAVAKLAKLGKTFEVGAVESPAVYAPAHRSMLCCRLHAVGDDAMIVLGWPDRS